MKTNTQRFDDAELAQRKAFRVVNFSSSRQQNRPGHCAIALNAHREVELAGVRPAALAGSAVAAGRVRLNRYVEAAFKMRRDAQPFPTTVAAISWPGILGYDTSGFWPRKVLKSVPHSPM